MKRLLVLGAACLLAFTMACDSGSSGAKVSDEDAMMMYSAVNMGIMEAYSAALIEASGTKVSVPSDPPSSGIIDWTNYAGITATGNWTNNGAGYITLNLTITFTDYTDSESGTVINGSTIYTYEGTSTVFDYSVAGDFVVTYQGTDYDFSWDMDISLAGGVYTYSGNYNIDGYSFTYSGSGSAVK